MMKILFFIGVLWLALAACSGNETAYPGDWAFPSMHIDGIGANEIHRREWLRDVNISISGAPAGQNFENAVGRIRGRGNSSWGMEKRPYRIRFDNRYTREMLGAGYAARDWTLIASHQDKSLMRHYSAYHFSGLLGSIDFVPFARFVHLYMDGAYQGVYMLSDQIEGGPGRAELTWSPEPQDTEFLIQLNMRAHYNNAIEGVDFITVNGSQYDFRFPRDEYLTPAHIQYVIDHLYHIDGLINARDDRVFDYICLDTFVDFYIINDLYKDQDAGRFSVFMQIRGTGDDRRLEMGPVWDFDIAAGNAYYQGEPWHSVDGLLNTSGYRYYGYWLSLEHRWYRQLMLNPTFFNAVVDRWEGVREDQFPALIGHIQFMASHYQADFERNFTRWPILGRYQWPNPQSNYRLRTFPAHVEYVTTFLQRRADWLSQNLWTRDAWETWEAYGLAVVSAFGDRNMGYSTIEGAAGGGNIRWDAVFVDGGQGFNRSEDAVSLFDFNTHTKYCASIRDHGPFWAVWRYHAPFVADRFIFATANDNASSPRRMGDGWTLSGSNDGVAWTVLHTGTRDAYSNLNHTFFYVALDNPGAFSYYRLESLAGGDGDIIQLSVVALTER